MKLFALSALILLSSMSSFAETIATSDVEISPSSIDKIVRLVDKPNPGSSHKKLQIVVTDTGMSTDVSPRYTVYLGYASMAEMGNMSANFMINDQALEFLSARRLSAGIYEVKTKEYRANGMFEVTQVINTEKMFLDEQKLRRACGGDFCHEKLESAVSVSTTVRKIR